MARYRHGCRGEGAVLTIFRVVETGSTNTDLLAMAARGEAHEGDWFVAERQTAGRGRMGRSWQSPAGNFYGSLLIRLQQTDHPAATLSFGLAVALHQLVHSYASESSLKWPNDVLIKGAKVAGILMERQAQWLVAGIGVNLCECPVGTGRPVTRLADWGFAPTQEDFTREAVIACDSALTRWRNASLAITLAEWQLVAHPRGAPLSAALPDGSRIDGVFDGLDGDGALQLRLADGQVRVIHAGDVFLI